MYICDMLNKKYSNQILLAIIMVVAAILRFYDFFSLPFTWDELSAWNRLHFNSFSMLIQEGVKPDGHPAGVQVFLYYWIKLFGDAEWVIKLPFNILGLLSVFVFYEIAKIWWNKSTGIIAAAFMASLQFFVLFSPIARPYISGLFFTLSMVYFWTKYMWQSPQKKFLAGFVIFAVLSAYNHHFSLLFAAIVGFSGLFTIAKKQIKEYIIAGLLIFVLYIPHLSIFFHQLEIGGIGGTGNWLGAPSPDFIWQFLYWSFHFSPWIITLIVLLSLFGFISEKRNAEAYPIQIKKRLLLFFWFILPLVIGYYYSVMVNPVIQYSMLIFSFPYLLLLLFGQKENVKMRFLIPITLIILAVNISTLVFARQHYQIIFKQPFEGTAKSIIQEKNISPQDIFLFYNTIPSYQEYYLEKYDIADVLSLSMYNKNYKLYQIDSILQNIHQKYLLASSLPDSYLPLIKKHFPYLVKRENGYTYESYLWSKSPIKNTPKFHSLISKNDFSVPIDLWKVDRKRIILDSIDEATFIFSPQQEWGFSYSNSLIKMGKYGSIIDIQVDISAKDLPNNAVLVAIISSKGKDDIWRGSDFNKQSCPYGNGIRLYYSIDTRILLNKKEYNNAHFKFYIWNKAKENFQVQEVQIYQRTNNPIKYGLTQKME